MSDNKNKFYDRKDVSKETGERGSNKIWEHKNTRNISESWWFKNSYKVQTEGLSRNFSDFLPLSYNVSTRIKFVRAR